MPLGAIAAGISIGSSILGGIGGLKANDDEKKAIKKQAELTYRTRMEEIRRAKFENEGLLDYNRAATYASNIQMSGSARTVMNEMESQLAADIAWRRDAAKLEREAILAGAPGRGADAAVLANTASNIGTALLGFS